LKNVSQCEAEPYVTARLIAQLQIYTTLRYYISGECRWWDVDLLSISIKGFKDRDVIMKLISPGDSPENVLYRLTTCLENLEMSGNLTAVREISEILLKIREMSWKKSCQGKVA